jgi:hypothetical protein
MTRRKRDPFRSGVHWVMFGAAIALAVYVTLYIGAAGWAPLSTGVGP